MNRNLGYFTCYGIEYVFDYLGEDRIKLRIEEIERKLTGSIGISLKDFIYSDSEDCYFDGKGVLWVFDLLIQWFNEIDFVLFLYENSKKYNEGNYHDGGFLKIKWKEYVESLNRLLDGTAEHIVYGETNKINPYWMEYHFFYMHLSKSIKNALRNIKELKLDLIGSYEFKKNKLIGRVLLEFKTRRKPLTGQYLMYREGFVWYNLEPKEMQDSFSVYQFTKDKEQYNLILEKEKLTARIELIQSNPYIEKSISVLQNIQLDQVWNEVIANYIGNFKEISLRIKQDSLQYGNGLISNGVLWDIFDYYEQESNYSKATKIAKLNNTHLEVWSEIPEDDEKEN